MIRVLIVDDSAVIRRILTKMLISDPAIDVVGVAANGRIALSKIALDKPDLVLLDVEMPEMDGLVTLAEIQKLRPKPKVIMFSRYTTRGAGATLEALSLGADDYVTKPGMMDPMETSIHQLKADLVQKIKALAGSGSGDGAISRALSSPPAIAAAPASSFALGREERNREPTWIPGDVKVVAIGASTGGPNALVSVLASLGPDFRAPMLIAQHMPPLFTRLLAERLSTRSANPVQEARPGEVLKPGAIWIAPGDFHLTVEREGSVVRIQTDHGEPVNHCRPSVDVLFRSVAKAFGPGVLAVVLTGMGQDGMNGAIEVRAQGGHVIAQDQATSVVWGMPGHVVRAGVAERVLPIDEIGREILRRTGGQHTGLLPAEQAEAVRRPGPIPVEP